MARSRVTRGSRWLIALPAGVGGAVFGALLGVAAAGLAGAAGGEAPVWLPAAIAGIMGTTAFLLRALLIEGSGDLARRVFLGADQGTTPEYSAARALEVRGQFEDALDAYLAGATEYPEDPEPLILAARLQRAELERPEEAIELLKRARAIPRLEPSDRIRIDRELVEAYDRGLGRPALAMPILARLAEAHASDRIGVWAAARLAAIRTALWSKEAEGTEGDGGRVE